MGGVDKALLPWQGRPLLAHVVERLRPQVGRLMLNANGDPDRFSAFGLTVFADSWPGQPGPLAGLLAGLAAADGADWVATVPCDAPNLPTDLVTRLLAGVGGQAAAIARQAGRAHPIFGLWRPALIGRLRDYLDRGERRVMGFADLVNAAVVGWPDDAGTAFANLNSPADLAEAQAAQNEVGNRGHVVER